MSEVLVSRQDRVIHITFNRPERLNAVNEALYRQTLEALERADEDPEVRCVVISGSGRAFCAGADLKAHHSGERTQEQRAAYIAIGQDVCKKIQLLNKPVIAQVHGYALGGGAEIAVSADFLIIAEEAKLGFPEVCIGTYVGGGVTNRLPRLIGLRKATELLLLGKSLTGQQCAEIGLANESPPERLLTSRTEVLVADLCKNAPLSIARIKAAIGSTATAEDPFRSEAEDLSTIMETDDWAEGLAAFAERRAPEFKGR